jgi:hypothetical protein
MGYNKVLVTVRHPPSHNAATTTAPYFLPRLSSRAVQRPDL